MNEDRFYCSFKNPRTGDRDQMWFVTDAARAAWLADYRGDFPTMAGTVETWFVSAIHEYGSVADLLPAPCAPGTHQACIVSRCGGRDIMRYNTCGKCGRQIERGDNVTPWMTEAELNDDTAIAEAWRNVDRIYLDRKENG
jgi:hypothetical protein